MDDILFAGGSQHVLMTMRFATNKVIAVGQARRRQPVVHGTRTVCWKVSVFGAATSLHVLLVAVVDVEEDDAAEKNDVGRLVTSTERRRRRRRPPRVVCLEYYKTA